MDHGYLIHGIRCMFLDKYVHLAPLYVQLVDMCKSQEVSMHSVFDPPKHPYVVYIYMTTFLLSTLYISMCKTTYLCFKIVTIK